MGKLSFRIAAFLLYLTSLLPFPILYLFADLIYLILYYLVGYRKDVVLTNLRNAFPEKSDSEKTEIAKKFYHFLADMIVESVKMYSISKENIIKRFPLRNPEEVMQYFEQGRSVILATGHYANWEWGNLIASARFDQVMTVYKPINNKNFEGLINHMRSRFGATMVAMRNTLRKMIELKNETFLSVFVSDQTPVRGETQFFTTFLNQPTAVFLGIEKIAKATNYPVVYCHMDKVKRGYYEATFKTLSVTPKDTAEYEITTLHIQELERIIQQRPELWLWSHKRWKFKPEDIQR